jgi:hypothetical protein
MNNTNEILKMMMDIKLIHCRRCNGLRKNITFDQLSPSAQESFKEYMYSAKFVYCEKCNEYSMITDYLYG